jgi:hypothetical protein
MVGSHFDEIGDLHVHTVLPAFAANRGEKESDDRIRFGLRFMADAYPYRLRWSCFDQLASRRQRARKAESIQQEAVATRLRAAEF